MLRLLRFFSKRNFTRRNSIAAKSVRLAKKNKVAICKQNCKKKFAENIAGYIGQTVTIFVNAGGIAGMGFTGILISANCEYVRLITRIGPAPACPLTNSRTSYGKFINSLGSVASIPISKITSFTHNAV
jgi:hypothetical protein